MKTPFYKKKVVRQIIFPLMIVIFVIFISGFVIYSSGFLISNLNQALNTDVKAAQPVKFDIEGFEKLNLIR